MLTEVTHTFNQVQIKEVQITTRLSGHNNTPRRQRRLNNNDHHDKTLSTQMSQSWATRCHPRETRRRRANAVKRPRAVMRPHLCSGLQASRPRHRQWRAGRGCLAQRRTAEKCLIENKQQHVRRVRRVSRQGSERPQKLPREMRKIDHIGVALELKIWRDI